MTTYLKITEMDWPKYFAYNKNNKIYSLNNSWKGGKESVQKEEI